QMVRLTGLQITGVEESPPLPPREVPNTTDTSIVSAPPDTVMRLDEDEDMFKMAAFGRNLATIAQTPSASSSSPLREPVRQASGGLMGMQKNFSTPFLSAPRETRQHVAVRTVREAPQPLPQQQQHQHQHQQQQQQQQSQRP
ncbi:hypothetical protein FOZ62_019019, partial [Perkinsus olseni]